MFEWALSMVSSHLILNHIHKRIIYLLLCLFVIDRGLAYKFRLCAFWWHLNGGKVKRLSYFHKLVRFNMEGVGIKMYYYYYYYYKITHGIHHYIELWCREPYRIQKGLTFSNVRTCKKAFRKKRDEISSIVSFSRMQLAPNADLKKRGKTDCRPMASTDN